MCLYRRVAIALVAAYAFGVLLIAGFSARLPDARDTAWELLPSDAAIIVFYFDDPVVRRDRFVAGIELMHRLPGATLVFVGGFRPIRGGYVGAEVMRREAISEGVDATRILTDHKSNDSYSNIVGALDALSAAGRVPSTVIFVSDRLHLLRLAAYAWLMGLSANVRLAPVRDPESRIEWLRRLGHEAIAWPALLIPRSWLAAYLAKTRSG